MIRRVVNHCAHKKTLPLIALLLCLSVPVKLIASELLPPLLKQTKALACAKTAPDAQAVLSKFWLNDGDDNQFPDENGQINGETKLHAATLDIVLSSLIETSEKFPSLRNQVERTLLQWNYCDVFQEGAFYNLTKNSTGLVRTRAAIDSPKDWQGFKVLGFLGENERRFIPNILALDQQSLRSDYEWLFHRIFREQCFPHPDTSELFDSTEIRLKENIVATEDTQSTEYPYQWDSECIYPRKAPKLATSVRIESMPQDIPLLTTQIRILPVPQLVPGLLTQVKLFDEKIAVPLLQPKVKIGQVHLLIPGLKTDVVLNPEAKRLQFEPVTLAVPKLATQLRFDPSKRAVPNLKTKVWVDTPKRVLYKTKLNDKKPTHYVAQPKLRDKISVSYAAAKPAQVIAKPNTIVDKNASLIEKVLGGLSNGGNVLIIDKIQLTVNEYNGTVETAISSSDLGATVKTDKAKPAFVKELLSPVPDLQKTPLIKADNTVTKQLPKLPVSKPSPYLEVPRLQSMLLVSQIKSTARHKPVKIRDKGSPKAKKKKKDNVLAKRKKSASVFIYDPYPNSQPAEKSIEQLLLEYQAYEERRKSGKIRLKKKQLDSYSVMPVEVPQLSTLFSYITSSAPLTVDASTLSPKLLVEKAKAISVPALESKVRIYTPYKAKLVRVPSLQSKVRIYTPYQSKRVKVPALKSKVWLQQQYKKSLVKVPSLSTMVFQQAVKSSGETKQLLPKPKSNGLSKSPQKSRSNEASQKALVPLEIYNESFEFSRDRLPDEIFEETLILPRETSAITTPISLSNDAPLPYAIEERFSDSPAKQSKPKKKTIGLAGNIYLKHSLKNSTEAIGGSINRKLIKDSYWFARVGWNYTLEESEDPFSYSWGIGYSDWHPGTFSAQLNNWGPIKPEEGLALEKAVANFGYSVKSELLKKYRLSLSGSVNVPIEGNSSIVGNIRWSPKENWFVNASVSQPLEGDGTPKWTYGFGYSDWRPNKINLQYSNYGPNEIPYHNYEANGTWSLSYNWKF